MIMEESVIKVKLNIKPNCLTSQLKKFILEEINKIYLNSCNKKYGYIVKINKIISYKNNNLSNITNSIVFDIIFKALTLKPKIGITLDCNISMIFQHGIFANVNELKVLIPISNLGDFEINFQPKSTPCINNKKMKKKCEIDDQILVRVTEIRYDKKKIQLYWDFKDLERL